MSSAHGKDIGYSQIKQVNTLTLCPTAEKSNIDELYQGIVKEEM